MIKHIKKISKRNYKVYSLLHSILFWHRAFLIKYFYKYILKRDFKKYVGYELNLDTPRTFNEKIQWLKAYYRDPLMAQCSDKIAVRDIVSNVVGSKYLVDVLGYYKDPRAIDPSLLPKKFVLKTNHASGQVIVCKDKSMVDWCKAKRTLKRWLSENFFYSSGEWIYKDIKSKIICERLLEGDIIDYKFMCFHGEPQMLFTCSERNKGLKVTFFDMDFNQLSFIRKYPSADNVKQPEKFNEMIGLARALAKDFPFVRVDFYENQGQVYFSELTFFPGNGMEWFEPLEWDYKLGEMLDLSKLDKRYVCKK